MKHIQHVPSPQYWPIKKWDLVTDLVLDSLAHKRTEEAMEILADDELKHHELPSEAEIDAMAEMMAGE